MSKKTPKFLYRYMSFNEDRCRNIERLRPIFSDNLLYFPSPGLFNDPFDCKANMDLTNIELIDAEIFVNNTETKPHHSKHARLHSLMSPDSMFHQNSAMSINSIINPMLENDKGVLSLTKTRDNILMWSHYGGSHQGICLEFDYKIANNLNRIVCHRVNYESSLPTLHDFVTRNDIGQIEMFLTRKSKHWRYEKEWRLIIVIDENNPRIRPYPPEMLTGIIFGCRMKEEHKALIRQWIANRNPKPQLYQAQIDNEKYALDIVPIE